MRNSDLTNLYTKDFMFVFQCEKKSLKCLFDVFINDLTNIVKAVTQIFADGIKVFSTIKKQEDLYKLPIDMDNLVD